METIIKVAQDPSTTKILQNFFAILFVNSTFSQTAHWTAKGTPSYADHLLYERLYKENSEELDSYIEQFIPLGGEQIANPLSLFQLSAQKIQKLIQFEGEPSPEDLAKAALHSELFLLANLKKLYKLLKEEKKLSMGADDLLMGMYQQHESHVYLLKQRLKKD
jgi:DNA-binding ferritin-like protein